MHVDVGSHLEIFAVERHALTVGSIAKFLHVVEVGDDIWVGLGSCSIEYLRIDAYEAAFLIVAKIGVEHSIYELASASNIDCGAANASLCCSGDFPIHVVEAAHSEVLCHFSM